MDPHLLRGAFRIGVLILFLALATLPFQDRSSPEFVVTVLAAAVGFVFLLVVGLLVRRASPPLPRDNPSRKDYNEGHSAGGKDQ